MGQNALSQLDLKILKLSYISWAKWGNILSRQNLLRKYLGGDRQNGRGLLSYGTLKSVVSQEWINESTCFFACWHKFRKAKCSFLTFLLGMAQNGRGLLSHWTLKSAVSWINESTFFFTFLVGMVQNGPGLLDHGTLLYLKNESLNWAEFLHVDSDAIIFG